MRTGLVYTASAFISGGVSAGDGIVEVAASLFGSPIILHTFHLTTIQAASAKATITLEQRSTGSGGTALTEIPLLSRNTTAASASVAVDRTVGFAGVVLESIEFDEVSGLHWLPAPKDRLLFHNANTFTVVAITAISSACAITIVWEEL